jgi:hypothetical protein
MALSVPDCPHVAVLDQRVAQALAERQSATMGIKIASGTTR